MEKKDNIKKRNQTYKETRLHERESSQTSGSRNRFTGYTESEVIRYMP